MSQQHPITPPPELVEKWLWSDDCSLGRLITITSNRLQDVATQAAQWGADQELEACVAWLDRNSPVIGGYHLRVDRRLNPPSLKEQALEQLDSLHADLKMHGFGTNTDTIRRALEALDD